MKIRIQPEPPQSDIKPSAYPILINYLNSIYGDIDRYNVKTMADGRQWVIHATEACPIERKDADPMRDSRGNIMWIRKGQKLSPLDRPTMHQWRNP